jgi:hypothetical protein
LSEQCDRWQATLDEAQHSIGAAHASTAENLVESLQDVLRPALLNHATSIDESAQESADRLERQSRQWQETMANYSESLSSQQHLLVRQYEALAESHDQTRSVALLQQTLDISLQRLTETNASIDRSIAAAGGDGMADAMRILARAVDVLSNRLAESRHHGERNPPRRAA